MTRVIWPPGGLQYRERDAAGADGPSTHHSRWVESGIVTMGEDVASVARFMRSNGSGYSAADVLAVLLSEAAR